MSALELLAVVEVEREKRIRCQATYCNHTVFRRIHVVRDGGAIQLYGSDCFRRLFAALPIGSSSPRFSSSDGRKLTDEERALLIANTEQLIRQFRAQWETDAAERKRAEVERQAAAVNAEQNRREKFEADIAEYARAEAERQAVVAKAKQNLRDKYDIDPNLPGWQGLVAVEVRRLLDENTG